MITFNKEQLIASAHSRIEFAEMMLAGELEPLKERTWSIELELARIALASLEAEPVVYSLIFRNMEGVLNDYVNANTTFSTMEKAQAYGRGGNYVRQNDGSLQWVSDPSLDPVVVPLYAAPPAPVSVPDDEQCKPHPVMAVKGELGFLDHFDRIISERDDDIDIGQLGHGNYEALMLAALDAFRAAMLQGDEPDFREITNSSTKHFRENAETSTNCPCCGRKPLKNKTCSVAGCNGKHVARGFCVKHYAIERKKEPSRRESIRAADKRYRARKAAAPQQGAK